MGDSLDFGRVKLIPEEKEKWLNALKSRKYKKGVGKLKKKHDKKIKHCCLGVWLEEKEIESSPIGSINLYATFKFLNTGIKNNKRSTIAYENIIPFSVFKKAFIKPEDMGIIAFRDSVNEIQSKLAEINDNSNKRHYTYTKVIKWIEENL